MRFATLSISGEEVAALRRPAGGWVPLSALDPSWTGDLLALIRQEPDATTLAELARGAARAGAAHVVPDDAAVFGPLYRRPRKIWGIGLNYREHATDLSESAPDEPASFIKGDHTIIGPGEAIRLPAQSRRVTAEAELGVVIGRTCHQVGVAEALDYVLGFCPVLDQTAEDILARNPRFLTWSKNFPTFFSFGPELVTPDEALAGYPSLEDVPVRTVHNGEVVRSNTVRGMMHGPRELISSQSHIMPLFPGDIISTGTPGAVALSPGDVVESRVGDLRVLVNPVG